MACVQNCYSVLDRASEPTLELCAEHDLAWVPFFPLGSAGFPDLRAVTDHPTVIAIASQAGTTPAQVGLAWLLAHYDNTLLIPGTSDPDHLDDNVAAGHLRLSAPALAALDRLTARH